MCSRRTHLNIRSCDRILVRGTVPCFKLCSINIQPLASLLIFSLELHLFSLLRKPLLNTFNTITTPFTRELSWRRTKIALTNRLNWANSFLNWRILQRSFSFLEKNVFQMIRSSNKSSHKEQLLTLFPNTWMEWISMMVRHILPLPVMMTSTLIPILIYQQDLLLTKRFY